MFPLKNTKFNPQQSSGQFFKPKNSLQSYGPLKPLGENKHHNLSPQSCMLQHHTMYLYIITVKYKT